MSYQQALEAAGYKVKAFESFGSYQGDWLAVTDKGLIHGSYGSCSGCDAFEAEFGWLWDEDADPAEKQRRLAQFGASYEPMNAEELTRLFQRVTGDIEWDTDAQAMLDFMHTHGFVTVRTLRRN